ncbi:uncharacterized protein CELE_R08C7.11 [Caenorhabditis elegans]|uniref:Secreted protein n=1 Tax=Caenorhabditis elegans TaxID=6239 RepID=Q21846_CAEEL|nr:Secreted protein [Caenorhabditis elegans]CCD73094.1 Secreted protein [Caenorhabditis elegans]|eukprot:NP_500572.1 Uncharacterized protein CELE_R08C7.11 [Caenorhabditis elegans]
MQRNSENSKNGRRVSSSSYMSAAAAAGAAAALRLSVDARAGKEYTTQTHQRDKT